MSSSVWTTLFSLVLLVACPWDPSVTFAQDAAAEKETVAKKETAIEKVVDKDAEKPAAEEPKKKPVKTVEAKKQPVAVYKTIDGRLESKQVVEIETNFKKWTDLKISSVAKQGQVQQGDALIAFDTESIDKAIVEAEFALRSASFAHQLASLAAENASRTFELDTTMAELAWKNAQEDNQYYKDVDVPQRGKDLDYNEKTAGYYAEYAKDELDQLQQMYTEDELTEESEAIVLKRAERDVESAQRWFESSMRYILKSRKFDHPRADKRQAHAFNRARMVYQKSKITLPITKQKAEIALEKAAFELEQKQTALDELKADRQLMTVVAPVAGFLFYGECDRGEWGKGVGSRDLKIDDKVKAKGVVMTIVDATQLAVRSKVGEDDLDDISAGMFGQAKFESAGGKIVGVSVDSIDQVPRSEGKHDCVISLNDDLGASLLPGVKCKVNFKVYENNDAIVVAKDSVFSDDDDFTHYVYVHQEDGEAVRTEVGIGRTSGKVVEVVKGLEAGDKIRKTKPTDDDK
jgi:multidrug efflux pump subunit AcrA (membrane-fusion protein)